MKNGCCRRKNGMSLYQRTKTTKTLFETKLVWHMMMNGWRNKKLKNSLRRSSIPMRMLMKIKILIIKEMTGTSMKVKDRNDPIEPRLSVL